MNAVEDDILFAWTQEIDRQIILDLMKMQIQKNIELELEKILIGEPIDSLNIEGGEPCASELPISKI